MVAFRPTSTDSSVFVFFFGRSIRAGENRYQPCYHSKVGTIDVNLSIQKPLSKGDPKPLERIHIDPTSAKIQFRIRTWGFQKRLWLPENDEHPTGIAGFGSVHHYHHCPLTSTTDVPLELHGFLLSTNRGLATNFFFLK